LRRWGIELASSSTVNLTTRPDAGRRFLLVRLITLVLLGLVSWPIPYLFSDYWGVVWALALAPLVITTRSGSVTAEMGTLLIVWWAFGDRVSASPAIYYCPLAAALSVWLTHDLGSRAASLLSTAVIGAWICRSIDHGVPVNLTGVAFLGCSALTMLVHAATSLRRPFAPVRSVDVIAASHTGNTLHLVSRFAAELIEAGVQVRIHRFFDPTCFTPALDGDALVVAFPMIGWKPPWPLDHYLRTNLPAGKGKPAFLLSTCAGGPENGFVLPWLWLWLKGYRVMGRLWVIYPVNVATFRIGPARLWRWLDSLLPRESEMEITARSARSFAAGKTAGFPLVVWPFPLVLIGWLLDNRWIDPLLYRPYAWRKRCTNCGLCVETCPMGRLHRGDPVPVAAGECELCMRCVNLCPQNALHLFCWTEYGQPYRPKWPELAAVREDVLHRSTKTG